jgi:hypothetical protein
MYSFLNIAHSLLESSLDKTLDLFSKTLKQDHVQYLLQKKVKLWETNCEIGVK